MLFIDLETRSRCDLPKEGAYKYAADPSTEIISIGWSLNATNGVARTYDDLPRGVKDAFGSSLVASFGSFDRLVWNAVYPDHAVPLNRWYCVQTQMRLNALPANLADASRAVYGTNNKDVRGAYLIRMLSKPQADGTFLESPELMKEMDAYCLQDVRLMVDLFNDTRTMTPEEVAAFHDSEAINDDGVCVDTYFAELASKFAGTERDQHTLEIRLLTNNEVTKVTQLQRISKIVKRELSPDALKLATITKDGVEKFTLDKNARSRLLVGDKENLIHLNNSTRQILETLDASSNSSTAKYARMLDMAGEGDRVRGAFVFAGASQTARFSSKGLQLHNFKRDALSPDEVECLITQLERDLPPTDLMNMLARGLRGAIVPEEGNVFVVGDWSAIEAGALPWLTDDPRANKRLNILRDPDKDLYLETCAALGLDSRQVGKVIELAFGYGGAVGAFNAMAAVYGVVLPEHQIKKLVIDWRHANPWAVTFWDSLMTAAMTAVSKPVTEQHAGRVSYCFYPSLVDGTLICTLPSGQMIHYPRCKLQTVTTKFGERVELSAMKANWRPSPTATEWPRVTLWRGLLAENVTQAVCGDVLRDALHRALESDMSVVAHVHDEIIVETPVEWVDETVADLQRIMEGGPSWAKGLPLIAKPEIMKRYGK
jgi:DNA polymerase